MYASDETDRNLSRGGIPNQPLTFNFKTKGEKERERGEWNREISRQLFELVGIIITPSPYKLLS